MYLDGMSGLGRFLISSGDISGEVTRTCYSKLLILEAKTEDMLLAGTNIIAEVKRLLTGLRLVYNTG